MKCQPKNYSFPATQFGNKKLSFQVDLFTKFPWLHYDKEQDAAFCFICVKAKQIGIISSTKSEASFTETGYRNWKKAIEKGRGFEKHQLSDSHR